MIWSIGTTPAAKWLPMQPKHHQRQARFFTTSAIFCVEAEVTKNFLGVLQHQEQLLVAWEKISNVYFYFRAMAIVGVDRSDCSAGLGSR